MKGDPRKRVRDTVHSHCGKTPRLLWGAIKRWNGDGGEEKYGLFLSSAEEEVTQERNICIKDVYSPAALKQAEN
jgi:hypothetical protein